MNVAVTILYIVASTAASALSQIGRRGSVPATVFTDSNVSMRKTKTAEMPLSQEQIGAICNLSFPDGFR